MLRISFQSLLCRSLLLLLGLFFAGDILVAATKIGFIGLRHSHCWRQLRDISNITEAEFVGVAESIPELVEEAKKIQPDAYYASDYHEFVQTRKPDIVWAFVENNRHLEIVEVLAPLGIHVIFEKPLAASYADAVRIRELAQQYGIQVMTNYQMAWWPSNHELRRQATEGKIGKVWRLHGIVGHGGPSPRGVRNKVFFDWLTDPAANGAGALVDFGIYNATWALWHLGLPTRVYATVNQLQPERFPKVEDSAVFVLTYPESVGIFEASWDLPHGFQQLELFGMQGSLVMTRNLLTHREGRNEAVTLESTNLDPIASHPVRYMIDRVSRGEPLEHIVALDINVDAVQILEAAKLSANEHRAVSLPLPNPGGKSSPVSK